MSFNFHLLKKWTNMVLGKSIYHVDQGIGKFYSKEKVAGFYNDLRDKVHKRNDSADIPMTVTDDGQTIYFPIEVAQYGLGAFDIYLENKDDYFLNIACDCADSLIEFADENGGLKTFEYIYKKHPYSSMAQSEAACLFMRVFVEKNEQKYLDHAKRFLDFMLLFLEEGGTAKYVDGDMYLCEHTDPSRTVVLNGWIFSLWGLYDYTKLTNDKKISEAYEKTLNTLKKELPGYDCKYWSYYDRSNRMTSPFYHKLHIAQLDVMYDITGDEVFKEYSEKWDKYQRSFFNPKRAFIKKAFQKLTEKL